MPFRQFGFGELWCAGYLWGYVLTQEYPVDPQEVTTIDDRLFLR